MAAAAVVVGATALGGQAMAQDPMAEAGQHYKTGVQLFKEGDYRAALIEFRRAYELVPDPNALFNIGESQYGLKDYVGALATLERVLAEGGVKLKTANREQAERDVEALRPRVATLEIVVNLAGADVAIDDQSVGQSPLDGPVAVSAGRRKITVTLEGHAAVTRQIDIGGREERRVDIELATSVAEPLPPLVDPAPHDGAVGADLPVAGWVVTGVLAAGAIGCGVGALVSSKQLENERATLTDRETLDSKQQTVTGLAVTTDVLIGAAVIAGAVSLGFTLAGASDDDTAAPAAAEGVTLELRVGPPGLSLLGAFF